MSGSEVLRSWEAIVLAGGLGTRLRSAIGENLPKPMAPILNRPFLEYLLDYWMGQGVYRFIFSVAYHHEVIQKHFGDRWKKAEIEYVVDEGLGTGGGVLQALACRKNPQSPVLVMNGDTYFEVPLKNFYEFHRSKASQASLTLLDFPESPGGRIKINSESKVTSFEPESFSGWVNGGVYLFEPDFLSRYDGPKRFSLEKDFLAVSSLRGDSCYGFPCQGRFCDIGTPESYQTFAKLMGSQN